MAVIFTQPGMLNKYIRYDTLMIALQYFSYALCRMPYMGVGRNLAYKRSLFYSGKGFSNHFHLASGDDDLFVNENATKTNTAIEFSHESHTRTAPKESFDKWFFQKKRHFSTNKLYKPVHKVPAWPGTVQQACSFMPALSPCYFTCSTGLWYYRICLSAADSALCY